MKPVLLIYGNCQSEALAAILSGTAATRFFDIVYLRSFEIPGQGRASIPKETLARCGLVWEQRDFEPFPYAGRLPEGCPVIVFPSLDLNALWPWNCENPYNRTAIPGSPFGPFHYGNRIVVNGIRDGADPQALLERVLAPWPEHAVDLDRLLEIEGARLRARDLHCDVRMGPVILDGFTRERWFFTPDHPSLALLVRLAEALIDRSCAFEPRLMRVDAGMLRRAAPAELLGSIGVPIAAHVARHYGLAWYREDLPWGTPGEPMDARRYFAAMIEHGMAMRDECTH